MRIWLGCHRHRVVREGQAAAVTLRAAAAGSLIVSLLSLGMTTLTSLLLARALGPEGRGAFEAIFFLPRALTPIAQLGLGPAIAYWSARDPARVPQLLAHALWLGPLMGGAAGLLVLPLLPLILHQYEESVVQLARLALVGIALGVVQGALAAVLLGTRDYHRFNALRLVQPVSELAAVALLSLAGVLDLVTATLQHLLTAGLLATLILLMAVRQHLGRVEGAALPVLGAALGYGAKTVTGTLADVAGSQANRLILLTALTPAELGLYVVATRLADLLQLFPQSLATFLMPEVARRRLNRPDGSLWRLVSACLALLSLGGGVLALAMPVAVALLYGTAFAEATTPARILVVGAVATGGTRLLAEIQRGLGRPIHATAGPVAGTVVGVAGLLLLVPPLGLAGAALATALGSIVGLLAASYLIVVARRNDPTYNAALE